MIVTKQRLCYGEWIRFAHGNFIGRVTGEEFDDKGRLKYLVVTQPSTDPYSLYPWEIETEKEYEKRWIKERNFRAP